ncbi:TetR family transcriptional regulator [Streptomyces sp. HCCB10043]|nr:TetR family transcriptional regulator [Streptomyces sp. HCCB10043]
MDGPAGEPQVGLLAGEGQVQAVTAGAGLQALEGSGLGESDKTSVALLVSSFVRSQALLMADLAAAVAARGVPPEEVNASYERTLKRLVDPARHPGISRLLESGAMSGPDDPDYEFTFGLERLLDGVEALIRKTDGGSRVPADGVNSV